MEVGGGYRRDNWPRWCALGAKLRTPKSVIERPVQHLFPLELSYDMKAAPAALKPTVAAFRPQRNASVAARARIPELAQMDDET